MPDYVDIREDSCRTDTLLDTVPEHASYYERQAVAALTGALTLATLVPTADLWQGDVSSQIEFSLVEISRAEAEMVAIEVSELEVTLEELVRRGEEAATRIPEDMVDIDF